VILAATAIAVVAYLDDTRQWPFWVKLGGQVLAALLAVGSGLYVTRLNLPVLGPVELSWVGPLGTVAWILFATNAMNFIDGLNGLASGVSALAALILAAIAARYGGWFVYFASLVLASGLLGFLPFNFPRARIFMGDVGSQFCGFTLAVLAIAAGRFQNADLSILLVPMLIFGVLYDVAFTLCRRLRAGDRLTQAHRGHLYQIAQRAGLSVPAVTLTHWAFVLWGGAVCLLFLQASGWAKALMPLLVLPPQLSWTAFVWQRAQRHPVGRW
jgi:UDP-GlcNAc:undecaprenyl-phosphate GlcNAc-1-phosphate transferase